MSTPQDRFDRSLRDIAHADADRAEREKDDAAVLLANLDKAQADAHMAALSPILAFAGSLNVFAAKPASASLDDTLNDIAFERREQLRAEISRLDSIIARRERQ